MSGMEKGDRRLRVDSRRCMACPPPESADFRPYLQGVNWLHHRRGGHRDSSSRHERRTAGRPRI